MLLTHRKLLQSKAIAIENDLRGTLRNFGLKVGMVGKVKFEARIKELVESLPDLAELVEPLLVVRRVLREQLVILHRRLLAIVRDDEVCRRLMTTPGVGPVVAPRQPCLATTRAREARCADSRSRFHFLVSAARPERDAELRRGRRRPPAPRRRRDRVSGVCSLSNFRLARSTLYPLARVAAEGAAISVWAIGDGIAPAVSYRDGSSQRPLATSAGGGKKTAETRHNAASTIFEEITISLKRAPYREPSYFRLGRTILRSDTPCACPDDPPRTSSPSWHLRCPCNPSCSFRNRQAELGCCQ
jgi:hypothetical protein